MVIIVSINLYWQLGEFVNFLVALSSVLKDEPIGRAAKKQTINKRQWRISRHVELSAKIKSHTQKYRYGIVLCSRFFSRHFISDCSNNRSSSNRCHLYIRIASNTTAFIHHPTLQFPISSESLSLSLSFACVVVSRSVFLCAKLQILVNEWCQRTKHVTRKTHNRPPYRKVNRATWNDI